MKKFKLAVLLSLFPTLALAQSQRNPCVYISTTIQTCVPVGNGLGIGTAPMPVGGLANASAPTYVEGQPGQLSFDLSGNLRVTTSSGGSSTVTQGNAGTNAQAWWVRIGDATNGPVSVSTGGADATINSINGLQTYSRVDAFNGTTYDRLRTIQGAVAAGTGTAAVAIAPTSLSSSGITSVVSAAAENSHVLKASGGNLYSAYATNLTSTAGFLVILNATSSPADGAITPLECVPLPASGNASISYNPGPSAVFSTGIVAVLTSATTCFTKTTGTITGFIKGSVL